MLGEPVRQETAEQALDKRIAAALEAAPRMKLPEDFAARVAARIPARAPYAMTGARRSYFGLAAIGVSLVALLAAMLWLAPRTMHYPVYWAGLEWLLCAQFCGLVLWATLGRRRLE